MHSTLFGGETCKYYWELHNRRTLVFTNANGTVEGRQAGTCDPRRHFARLSRTRVIRFKTGSLKLKKAMHL